MNGQKNKQHIHFIGICGVAMSALAILWHKKGWKVTGSDAGFYPPISTHLQKNNIAFYPGWHPEKMGNPDLVVVGNVASSENPELKYVLEHAIPHLSYPELVAQNIIKENSIVCAGTYGKTSTSTLLSLILKDAGLNPAYMFGGLSLDLENSADNPENSTWSVLEGDEYKTSKDDVRAKFFSYKPTHLLLTSSNWDHVDIYKTETDYFEAFKKLVTLIPKNGLIVACSDNQNVKTILSSTTLLAPIITYGKESPVDYFYHSIQETAQGLTFQITHQSETFIITSPVLGAYMAENICGAFALAHSIGIDPKSIIQTISKFHGLKRRLEKRGTINGAVVFDDIAHSPIKAKSVLETLRRIYTGTIFAIFEPNTGNRKADAAPFYDYAFAAADEILIPEFTKTKKDTTEAQKILEASDVVKILKNTHHNVSYFNHDTELTKYLKQKTQPNDVVVFMGSHGFRGMIENVLG
jgi:UDP-N-acetylmuramate: L-alanyl-gamma-D-glutamyl-meso-diaminopimelate ligase